MDLIAVAQCSPPPNLHLQRGKYLLPLSVEILELLASIHYNKDSSATSHINNNPTMSSQKKRKSVGGSSSAVSVSVAESSSSAGPAFGTYRVGGVQPSCPSFCLRYLCTRLTSSQLPLRQAEQEDLIHRLLTRPRIVEGSLGSADPCRWRDRGCRVLLD
jgi:hypothetical protein